MSKLQRDLLETARSLTAGHLRDHQAFAPYWEDISIIMSGSAVTDYADEYSGIDFIVLGDDDVVAELCRRIQDSGGDALEKNLISFQLGNRRVKASFFSFARAEQALAEHDDFALAAFRDAPALHDPDGRFARLVEGLAPVPREVWAKKIADRYRKLRYRQAALAWNLRRGQPYAILDNLNRFLAHALSICFYVHGQPPTGRKWIFQGALRLEAGRRLRPYLFELFSSLDELATLGGSLNPRQNRLYQRVSAIHDQLIAIIEEAGFQLQGDGADEDAVSAP